jgi:hypothetical protein
MARNMKPFRRHRAAGLTLAGALSLAAVLAAAGRAQTVTGRPVPAVSRTEAIPAVFPSGGPLAGGTMVTITGPNLAGAIAVSFGPKPATSFEVSSASQIVAVSPPASAGTVEVQVTTAAGAPAASSVGTFTYAHAPTVRSEALSAREPTSVTLHGTVNPDGLPLIGCQFRYGTTTSYGHTVACAHSVATTEPPVAVSATLNGLLPATGYHYELTVNTLAGTTSGAGGRFTTSQLRVVGAPLVGLLVERVTNRPGFIGELLGIQGITGAARGESLELFCVAACGVPLALNIPPLDADVVLRKITLARAVLLSVATRIEIEVSARGEISRYATYAFTAVGPSLAVSVTASGCLSANATAMRCPA